MSLKSFEKNIQSQFGEDGVIEEIFNRIGTANKICVEFGAWDGIHLSNAWNLWHNKNWKALLIEGDNAKYELLVSNTKGFNNVNPYLAYVAPEGENSLDSILKKMDFPLDIDMLSIDIDGDDYYILNSLNLFKPRLILVEYNPTIPPDVDILQKQGGYFGCSALPLLKLGHKKGYKLAHITDTNLFLVKDEFFPKLNFNEPNLKDVFVTSHLTYLISGYDGKSFLVGNPPYLKLDTLPKPSGFPILITENVNIRHIVLNRLERNTNYPLSIKSFVKKFFNKFFK